MEIIRLIIDSIAGIIIPVIIAIIIPIIISIKNRQDTESTVNLRLDRLEKQVKEYLRSYSDKDKTPMDKYPKGFFSKLSADEENEIKKVKKRISRWFLKRDQKNSRILYTFIKLYEQNNGVVTYDQLNEEANIPKFKENFDQMKIISRKNHGKIFEQTGNNIKLWKEVEDIIWDYYKQQRKSV